MRTDGKFIGIEVSDAVAGDAAVAAKLEEVCPVSIYQAGADGVQIVEQNVDECVLCRLCLEDKDIPAGSVQVLKLYDGGVAL